MTDKAQAARELVRAAIQFADAAAGEGVVIEGAPEPDDFLVTYAAATGDDAMDTLPDRVAAMVAPVPEGSVVLTKEWLEAASAAYERCKLFPEASSQGIMALITLRNLYEKVVEAKPISRGAAGPKS